MTSTAGAAHARSGLSLGLRRAVLAASVLADLDLAPGPDGVTLLLRSPVTVPWAELAGAVADLEGGPGLPRRVTSWLKTRAVLAELGPVELARRARPLGRPVGRHGDTTSGWTRTRVLGGALDLGLGFVGIGPDPDHVTRLVDAALAAGGARAHLWWTGALDHLERMGAIAAERLPRPARVAASTTAVLRPIGDVDVVTLLGSRTLRAALAGADGTGMRAVAVPMRRRGWLDLRAIDPAFVAAAALATAPSERGFDRPVLVTADELRLAPVVDPRQLARIALRDPAPAGLPPAAR